MALETLDQIGCRHGTDKASNGWHDYLVRYEQWFAPLRHQPIRLLEMGVLGGQSIRTWAEYFDHPDTRIFGVDIELHRCQPIADPRVRLDQISQTHPDLWNGHFDPFDICIDDGSHRTSEQVNAFFKGWLKLKRGGIWIVEDCHVWNSVAHSDMSKNIMQWLHELTYDMIAQGGAEAQAKNVTTDIADITFSHGFAVIRKAL